MIIGLWHPGSGMGDQLFCYLAARITAQRLGVGFGMVGDFKGDSFMNLYKGASHAIGHHIEMPAGKIIIDRDGYSLYEGKTYYDPEFNFIEDMTIVDGCRIQDERYWEGYPIREWLRVESLHIPDDVCVIGFRGGEYTTVHELFLRVDYWSEAIIQMRNLGIDKFEVHTDDPVRASEMLLPLIGTETKVIHDICINWRSIRYAKHAIIANSAFYIIPRLLSGGTTIAPRYWARRNIKEWSLSQNYYGAFTYV